MWFKKKRNDDEVFLKIRDLLQIAQTEIARLDKEIELLKIRLRSKAYKSKNDEDMDVYDKPKSNTRGSKDPFDDIRKLNENIKNPNDFGI